VTLLTDRGRVTLSGDKLIYTEAGRRREQVLESETEILRAYRRYFGMKLEELPRIDRPPVSS
jgi:N-hydroxyarylamine O-acetyltransferase